MCIMWKARGVMWQNAGIPVEIANPKEGIVLYVSELAIPRNAKNKDAAYAYLNAMLEPQPQQEFAKNMGYNPTASNSGLPADMATRIGFDKAIEERFMVQDQEYLAQNDPQLHEWWNKVFKA
jgi:putative spermidine/putrescine transport system substrate-binding protein